MSLVIDERIDSITTYPRKGTETPKKYCTLPGSYYYNLSP